MNNLGTKKPDCTITAYKFYIFLNVRHANKPLICFGSSNLDATFSKKKNWLRHNIFIVKHKWRKTLLSLEKFGIFCYRNFILRRKHSKTYRIEENKKLF